MKTIRAGIAITALSFAFTLVLPVPDSLAGASGRTCAKREIVAMGSSGIAKMLAKVDAEIAWEIKAVNKHGLLWYSWWAAGNHRFRCRTKDRRTICVARGTPCRLL